MILVLITATASVAVYLAICLRFLGAIVSNNGLLNHILFISEGKEIILRLEGDIPYRRDRKELLKILKEYT